MLPPRMRRTGLLCDDTKSVDDAHPLLAGHEAALQSQAPHLHGMSLRLRIAACRSRSSSGLDLRPSWRNTRSFTRSSTAR